MNLLLAAFPPELADLRDAPPQGWVLACTGIGALEAAVTTTRLLAEHRPERVLFLGTCGSYEDGLPVGSLLSASEAIATSAPECRGAAFRPQVERTRWAATWELPLRARAVAVPPAITRDPNDARLLGAVAQVEHLELTGVFAACHAAGISVAAALAVANRVGPEAHREWMEHHAQVSQELVDALRANAVL